MPKKMLHTKALVLKENINLEKGTIDAVVGSTNVIDRYGDIIEQKGWTLKNYKANPVILWGHNQTEDRLPIGKALRVWVKDRTKKNAKLMFKIQMDLEDSFAVEILRKIKEGFLNTVSVGFLPSEWEDMDPDDFWGGRKYTKQDLLELSIVPVPANPEAVIALKGMSKKDSRFAPNTLKNMFPEYKNQQTIEEEEEKSEDGEEVIEDKPNNGDENEVVEEETKDGENESSEKENEEGFEKEGETEAQPEEESEDKEKKGEKEGEETVEEEEKSEIEEEKKVEGEKGYIRFKDLDILPETEPWDGPGEVAKAEVSDLKLMCTWFDDEESSIKSSYKLPHHKAEGHKAVWRGVASAMAKLLGAKGGTEIPEAARKSVYNHLKKHYKQFEKDVPSFTLVEDQVLACLTEEIQVLSLEREEKHITRLIKKVLKKQNEQKKRAQAQSPTLEQNKKALEVINLALSLYKQDSSEKGV